MNGLEGSYYEISHAIQACDTPIVFEEMLEKVLNYKAQLNISGNTSTKPATSFVASIASGNPSTYATHGRGFSSASHAPFWKFNLRLSPDFP